MVKTHVVKSGHIRLELILSALAKYPAQLPGSGADFEELLFHRRRCKLDYLSLARCFRLYSMFSNRRISLILLFSFVFLSSKFRITLETLFISRYLCATHVSGFQILHREGSEVRLSFCLPWNLDSCRLVYTPRSTNHEHFDVRPLLGWSRWKSFGDSGNFYSKFS